MTKQEIAHLAEIFCNDESCVVVEIPGNQKIVGRIKAVKSFDSVWLEIIGYKMGEFDPPRNGDNTIEHFLLSDNAINGLQVCDIDGCSLK
jgi:hypothetical protein